MAKERVLGKVMPVQKKWLTREEAMAYLGCSKDHLEDMRNRADISYSKIAPRIILYDLESIDRFIERHRI